MALFSLNVEKDATDEEKQRALKNYRALFDSTNDAIMTLEPPTWKFTRANLATLRMFGCASNEQFESLPPWELSPERQPDGQLSGDKAKAMIMKAMQEGKNFFEWQHRRYQGEEFPATVLLTKLTLGDKEFLQAIVRDISAEKEVKVKLKEQTDENKDLRDEINKLKAQLG